MPAHSPVGAKIYVDYGRSSDLSRIDDAFSKLRFQ